ncbi:MAG: hypothetical protein SFT93_00065 [Rickettsiaceae bacterium]|nr:hypothetical protein [Rickettsiaceae bacterium]
MLQQDAKMTMRKIMIFIQRCEEKISAIDTKINSKYHEIYLDELDLLIHKHYLNIAAKLANKVYLNKKKRSIPGWTIPKHLRTFLKQSSKQHTKPNKTFTIAN